MSEELASSIYTKHKLVIIIISEKALPSQMGLEHKIIMTIRFQSQCSTN